MAFWDWLASFSPVQRTDADGAGRARIFSADMCPLTYSFWVVEDETPASATPREEAQQPLASV